MERIAPVMAVAISLDAIDNLQLNRAGVWIPVLIDIDANHQIARRPRPPRHNFYSLYIGIRAEGLAADADAFAQRPTRHAAKGIACDSVCLDTHPTD